MKFSRKKWKFNHKIWAAVVLKRLLGVVLGFALFTTGAFAQDAVCFMEWKGQIVDLTNSLCRSQTLAKPLSFSNVQIASAGDGSSVEVRGTVVNNSNQAVPLSVVNFNLIDKGRVLISDRAVVLAGGVIQPGEELAFSKLIGTNTVGEKVNISYLQVQVTGSI